MLKLLRSVKVRQPVFKVIYQHIMSTVGEFRIETDTLGTVYGNLTLSVDTKISNTQNAVPKDSYWGAQTQRSVENFPICQNTNRMPIEIIRY